MPQNVKIEERGDNWFLVWDPVPGAVSYCFLNASQEFTVANSEVNISAMKKTGRKDMLVTFLAIGPDGKRGEPFTGFMSLPNVAVITTQVEKKWNLWTSLAKLKPSLPKIPKPSFNLRWKRRSTKPKIKLRPWLMVWLTVLQKTKSDRKPSVLPFQRGINPGMLHSWQYSIRKKFFPYALTAKKLWPRGQSITIKQTTENKTSPIAAEMEEKKVMKTLTTTLDGKGLTINGADDPAIAGFALALEEAGSKKRVANAIIEPKTPALQYRLDNWLEKLGKPEEIKAKLKAGSGCVLKVFVLTKGGPSTPLSQHEFDPEATEKIFGTPKSEPALPPAPSPAPEPTPTPQPGFSEAQVAEMIAKALAAQASEMTQAQVAANAKKVAAETKLAEVLKDIETAKAAEAAKNAKAAQEKQGEKFPWKSWINFKLIRQYAGWLALVLVLILLAWSIVYWDLIPKVENYLTLRRRASTVATASSSGMTTSSSNSSLGDIPVTPDNDPNSSVTATDILSDTNSKSTAKARTKLDGVSIKVGDIGKNKGGTNNVVVTSVVILGNGDYYANGTNAVAQAQSSLLNRVRMPDMVFPLKPCKNDEVLTCIVPVGAYAQISRPPVGWQIEPTYHYTTGMNPRDCIKRFANGQPIDLAANIKDADEGYLNKMDRDLIIEFRCRFVGEH